MNGKRVNETKDDRTGKSPNVTINSVNQPEEERHHSSYSAPSILHRYPV
ncbi:hypothetical protein Trydic_g11887, partial [Trypoxylus dichotomus]